MRPAFKTLAMLLTIFGVLLAIHGPLLGLTYYWDEVGYYIPAARDFYHSWLLIPTSTLPEGHTPLVMIYLGGVWHLINYSAWATRAAMALIAAATVTTLYSLGRRVSNREVAAWSALLLAISPVFFAQSTLAHLDLAAGLFTTMAILFLLEDQEWLFALTASLAILSKETAVIMLPVVWVFVAVKRRRRDSARRRYELSALAAIAVPLLPLAAWTLYYHHVTGYWTGNASYLTYNLHSTLSPAHSLLSLLRRVYELLLGGFDWLLTASALAGMWWKRREGRNSKLEIRNSLATSSSECRASDFALLAAGLIVTYLLFLSMVGGAILPRYLLPIWPVYYLLAVIWVMQLPRVPARLILTTATACFIWAWFMNPPYPFPYEDNLAYADFIRLHQQAARYLEAQPGLPRILTAWPATNELTRTDLGYVQKPLTVVAIEGFAPRDFADVPANSFDLLYLYSRRWEPKGAWAARIRAWLNVEAKYFDYHPQEDSQSLVASYHLRLLRQFELRGQWVKIYTH